LAQAKEQSQREWFTAQQKTESAAFAIALSQPCPEHKAGPGKPCWRLPTDSTRDRASKGVCGPRITQAMGVARLRWEREQREAEQQQQARQRASEEPAMTATSGWISASHRDVDLDAEIRQSQAARFEAIERARQLAREPAAPEAAPKSGRSTMKRPTEQPAGAPAKPVKPAPRPRPQPRPQRVSAEPAPASTSPSPTSVTLPAGSVILSPEEMRAVDHLLATHPETKNLFTKTKTKDG